MPGLGSKELGADSSGLLISVGTAAGQGVNAPMDVARSSSTSRTASITCTGICMVAALSRYTSGWPWMVCDKAGKS